MASASSSISAAVAESPEQGSDVSALAAWVTDPVEAVERRMRQEVESLDLPENLKQAITYALLGGGKRLRPLLTVHSCLAIGGSLEDCLPAACAVEMVHAFSLVHDDLPALDDDDLRRGRPTVHVEHGEAMAILAGDGLLSIAFDLVSRLEQPAWLGGRLSSELAGGTTRMIAGQVLDTLGGFAPGLSPDKQVGLIHSNKTGALLRASCRMGALCGMARIEGSIDDDALRAITTYGESIGLMFQIVDDLLDVEQSTEHLGKRASKDTEAGKLTFPGVFGVERSRHEITRLRGRASESLQRFGSAARGLLELCRFLAVRTR